MTRKCRLKSCRSPLPKKADCKDVVQWEGFCEWACMNAYTAERKERAEKRRREHKRKVDRELTRKQREALMTRSEWVSKAQGYVNKLVVLEDGPKGCICKSCDSPVSDAGHFFHRGSKYRTSPLTLDRRNLNGQCGKCNRYKGGGSQYEYMRGYIDRYGEAAFRELEEFKLSVDRGEVPELTIDECKEIIKATKIKIKEFAERRAA